MIHATDHPRPDPDEPTRRDFARKHPAHWVPFERHNRSTIIYCTACTQNRRKVLANETAHAAIQNAWRAAGFWRIGRYMIMPDHVHFFCSPAIFPNHPLRDWMAYWRRLTAEALGERRLWQKDYWDRQLRTGESYAGKWHYVRNNPVRAKLVTRADDWPYQGELNVLPWHE
jgi:putative transposase